MCIRDSTYTYQWLRDGIPIVNATKLSYTLSHHNQGSNITFRICGSKTYYSDLCITTVDKIVEPGVISKVGVVTISGKATNPGALLTGTSTQWMAGVNLSSQWLLNGKPIYGATKPLLIIQPKFRGKTLSYQITGTRPGYQSVVKVSKGRKIV